MIVNNSSTFPASGEIVPGTMMSLRLISDISYGRARMNDCGNCRTTIPQTFRPLCNWKGWTVVASAGWSNKPRNETAIMKYMRRELNFILWQIRICDSVLELLTTISLFIFLPKWYCFCLLICKLPKYWQCAEIWWCQVQNRVIY